MQSLLTAVVAILFSSDTNMSGSEARRKFSLSFLGRGTQRSGCIKAPLTVLVVRTGVILIISMVLTMISLVLVDKLAYQGHNPNSVRLWLIEAALILALYLVFLLNLDPWEEDHANCEDEESRLQSTDEPDLQSSLAVDKMVPSTKKASC